MKTRKVGDIFEATVGSQHLIVTVVENKDDSTPCSKCILGNYYCNDYRMDLFGDCCHYGRTDKKQVYFKKV